MVDLRVARRHRRHTQALLEAADGGAESPDDEVLAAIRPLVRVAMRPLKPTAPPKYVATVRELFTYCAVRGYVLGDIENTEPSARPGVMLPAYWCALAAMFVTFDTGEVDLDKVAWYVTQSGYYVARTGAGADELARVLYKSSPRSNTLEGYGATEVD